MADKEEKMILEREYIVPLRKTVIRTPKYKRVPKAVKVLKMFIARHMKVEERDLKKVKIDRYLNEELWFKGIRKPAGKIRVKCRKFDSGIVKVELVEIPQALKWKKAREEKVGKEVEKKIEEKKAEEKKVEEGKKEERGIEEKVEETKEEKAEEKEKEKATVEAGMKEAEMKAKEIKHEVKVDKGPKHKFRQALKK